MSNTANSAKMTISDLFAAHRLASWSDFSWAERVLMTEANGAHWRQTIAEEFHRHRFGFEFYTVAEIVAHIDHLADDRMMGA